MASVYFPSGMKPVIYDQAPAPHTARSGKRKEKFVPPGPGSYRAPSSFAIIQDRRNAVGTKIGRAKRQGMDVPGFANVGPGKYQTKSSLTLLSSPRDNPGTKVLKDSTALSSVHGYRDPEAKGGRSKGKQKDLFDGPAPGSYFTNETWTSFDSLKGKTSYPGATINRLPDLSAREARPTHKVDAPGPGQYTLPTAFKAKKADSKMGKAAREGPINTKSAALAPGPGAYEQRTTFRALSTPRDNPGFKMGCPAKSSDQEKLNSVKSQEGTGTTPAPGYYDSSTSNTSFRALAGNPRYPGPIFGCAGMDEPGRPNPNEVPMLREESKPPKRL